MRYKTICNERPVRGFCARREAVLCAIHAALYFVKDYDTRVLLERIGNLGVDGEQILF